MITLGYLLNDLNRLFRLQAKFEAVLGKGNREMEMTDNCSVNVGYENYSLVKN